MLARVESLLATKRLHSELLDAGLLGGERVQCSVCACVCARLHLPAHPTARCSSRRCCRK